jgi:hypothetical protein
VICKANLVIEGQHADRIKYGISISCQLAAHQKSTVPTFEPTLSFHSAPRGPPRRYQADSRNDLRLWRQRFEPDKTFRRNLVISGGFPD